MTLRRVDTDVVGSVYHFTRKHLLLSILLRGLKCGSDLEKLGLGSRCHIHYFLLWNDAIHHKNWESYQLLQGLRADMGKSPSTAEDWLSLMPSGFGRVPRREEFAEVFGGEALEGLSDEALQCECGMMRLESVLVCLVCFIRNCWCLFLLAVLVVIILIIIVIISVVIIFCWYRHCLLLLLLVTVKLLENVGWCFLSD